MNTRAKIAKQLLDKDEVELAREVLALRTAGKGAEQYGWDMGEDAVEAVIEKTQQIASHFVTGHDENRKPMQEDPETVREAGEAYFDRLKDWIDHSAKEDLLAIFLAAKYDPNYTV